MPDVGPVVRTQITDDAGLNVGVVGDRLKVDVPLALLPATGTADTAHGRVTGSALTPVRETSYSAQTTNGQRSIVSSSTGDAAAGTGARTIKIIYLASDYSGPFEETLTLNGTTAVNTVATNICKIEKIQCLSFGSFGGNQGVISLKAAAGGGGATISSIPAGVNRTYYAHHYIPLGKTGYIRAAVGGCSAGDTATFLFCFNYSGYTDHPDRFRVEAGGSFYRPYSVPLLVPAGCNFVSISVEPDAAGTYFASIDYYDV